MSANPPSGYGQGQPADFAHEYNRIKFIVEQLLKKKSTAHIVQITGVAYSAPGDVAPTGRVSVQPLVNLQDGAQNTMENGIVHGIQYGRMQGGKNAIICDPEVGDIGIMVCEARDISAVKNTGAAANPGSVRFMDIADGMYVCSLLSAAPPVQYVRFTDDSIFFMDKTGNTTSMTPEGVSTVLADNETSITLTPGKITLVADEIVTHARLKNVWDAGGTGFVYQPNTIDDYTQGVTPTPHVPHPPEVPT